MRHPYETPEIATSSVRNYFSSVEARIFDVSGGNPRREKMAMRWDDTPQAIIFALVSLATYVLDTRACLPAGMALRRTSKQFRTYTPASASPAASGFLFRYRIFSTLGA